MKSLTSVCITVGIISALVVSLYFFLIKNRNLGGEAPKLLVVLGSGGHTAEMIMLLRQISVTKYPSRVYVAAKGDTLSASKITEFEQKVSEIVLKEEPLPPQLRTVTRARKVGQSYFTSVFTTLTAFIQAFPLVIRERPNVVLLNGPGSCLPIAVAAWVLRAAGILHCRILFVESFCRVTSLSLSARLLRPFVDRIVTQWPDAAPAPTWNPASLTSSKVVHIPKLL